MTEINGLCTYAYWNGLCVRSPYGIPEIVRTVRGEDRVEGASIVESINDNRLWKEYFSKKGRNNLTPQKKKQLRVMMDSKECRTVFKNIAAEKHEFSVPVKRFVGKSEGKRKRAVYTFNDYETMGALFEQQRAGLMALTLWQRLLAIIKHLLEVLADVLGVTYEELSATIVRDEKMLEKYIVMAEVLKKLDEAA